MLVGDRTPDTPPLTINTYSWFIKHADQLKPDVYGVVVCDEAHTALGEKTAAAIRSLSEPVYIGMTATDQLLQKHVGDVFPAEVADLPLAEAVRRGVVAPLRCSRVRPIASLRTVEIVGGDFDQGQLAARSTSIRSTWPPPTSTRAGSATRRASSTRPASTTPSGWRRP